MRDPYEVLGVPRDATEDQIKEAYRSLANKYQSDNYNASPLSDIAKEKMDELNNAYDKILEERRNLKTSSPYGNYSYSENQSNSYKNYGYEQYNNQSQSSSFQSGYYDHIRSNGFYNSIQNLINNGEYDEAISKLNELSLDQRRGEWNYLRSLAAMRKGWSDEAKRYILTALEYEPANPEFSALQNQIDQMGRGFNPNQSSAGRRQNPNAPIVGCSCCDMCTGLMCADCCCECTGFDLCPCC